MDMIAMDTIAMDTIAMDTKCGRQLFHLAEPAQER